MKCEYERRLCTATLCGIIGLLCGLMASCTLQPVHAHPARRAARVASRKAKPAPVKSTLFYSDTLSGRVAEYDIQLLSASMDAQTIRQFRDSIVANPDDADTNAQTVVKIAKVQIQFVEDLATAQRMIRSICQDKAFRGLLFERYYFDAPYHFADVYPDTFTQTIRQRLIVEPLLPFTTVRVVN